VPERRRVQRIAGGGIVRQRSLFEVGEAGQDELVVPLPGNRKVPVEMKGAGRSRGSAAPSVNLTSNVTLNVVSDDKSFAQRVQAQMPEIERALTATLSQGMNRALQQSVKQAAK
jgi:SLT domain-containing protein